MWSLQKLKEIRIFSFSTAEGELGVQYIQCSMIKRYLIFVSVVQYWTVLLVLACTVQAFSTESCVLYSGMLFPCWLIQTVISFSEIICYNITLLKHFSFHSIYSKFILCNQTSFNILRLLFSIFRIYIQASFHIFEFHSICSRFISICPMYLKHKNIMDASAVDVVQLDGTKSKKALFNFVMSWITSRSLCNKNHLATSYLYEVNVSNMNE